jgi:hypothetical protein
MSTPTLTRESLAQFTNGSENIYLHPLLKFRYTDGVKHVVDAGGANWLVTIIGSLYRHPEDTPQLQNMPHQYWTLKVHEDRSATLTCGDGNDDSTPVYTHQIDYTDFPLNELQLWLMDGTLLLPSEY